MPDTRIDPALTPALSPTGGVLDGAPLPPSSLSAPVSLVPVVPGSVHRSARRRTIPRAKPPKDSRVYKASLAIVALRAQGAKWDAIADTLGLTKNTVQTYLKRSVRKGWINLYNFDDPEDQLEVVLKSKVTKNLSQVLDEVSTDGSPSDRAVNVSMEVAKGTGLLKTHQVVKGEQTTQIGMALRVQVDMPPSLAIHQSASAPLANIGGKPYFDAEVIEQPESER